MFYLKSCIYPVHALLWMLHLGKYFLQCFTQAWHSSGGLPLHPSIHSIQYGHLVMWMTIANSCPCRKELLCRVANYSVTSVKNCNATLSHTTTNSGAFALVILSHLLLPVSCTVHLGTSALCYLRWNYMHQNTIIAYWCTHYDICLSLAWRFYYCS